MTPYKGMTEKRVSQLGKRGDTPLVTVLTVTLFTNRPVIPEPRQIWSSRTKKKGWAIWNNPRSMVSRQGCRSVFLQPPFSVSPVFRQKGISAQGWSTTTTTITTIIIITGR